MLSSMHELLERRSAASRAATRAARPCRASSRARSRPPSRRAPGSPSTRPALIWSFSCAMVLAERLHDLGGRARVFVAPRDAGHADEARRRASSPTRGSLSACLIERVLDDLVLDARLAELGAELGHRARRSSPCSRGRPPRIIRSNFPLIAPMTRLPFWARSMGARLLRLAAAELERVDANARAHRRRDA